MGSRGAVRVPSTLATKATDSVRILGVAICSRVYFKRSESRDGYRSAIEIKLKIYLLYVLPFAKQCATAGRQRCTQLRPEMRPYFWSFLMDFTYTASAYCGCQQS